MLREYRVGRIFGMEIRATVSALYGAILLWVVFAGAAYQWIGYSALSSALLGWLATLLHLASIVIHHLGHAIFARRTGHPMQAIVIGRFLFLGLSKYPADESELAASVHIQRALGGPIASALAAAFAGMLAFSLRREGGAGYGLALFAFWDNFLIQFLGVFLPLGFTDMSTILRWWGKSK